MPTRKPTFNVDEQVKVALEALKRASTKSTLEGMARFGIPSDNALGVRVGDIQKIAKPWRRQHDFAEALWSTGCYEARMLATFVDDPKLVTPVQMDRWARDFDSWAICDTACFHLFDRTPHVWKKIDQWAAKPGEFVKRAAFALLAGLTIHDKKAADDGFLVGLKHIEHAATDERNFVKKAVNWALRSIGKRNLALHAAALDVAERLASTSNPAARWVGKDAVRELKSPTTSKRLEKKHVR